MTLNELVNKYKSHEVDFVLPREEGDIPIYLDLFLLYKSPDQRWHKVQALIHEYFNFYLKKYRSNKISGENLIKMLKFPEVPFIALGYCEKGIYGSGGGKDRGKDIKSAIFDNKVIQEIGINVLAEMSITIEDIGPDILSDMVANFAMDYLLDYTNEQVEIFGLSTAEYQIERALEPRTMTWNPRLKVKLPYFESGQPRILIPKHLVRKLPVFSTLGFYRNFLRFILKQEEDRLIHTFRTIGKRPKVSFKQIEKELKLKYGSLEAAARIIAQNKPGLVKKYIQKPKLYESVKRKRKKKETIDWNVYIESIKNMPAIKKMLRYRTIIMAVIGII